MTQLPSKIVTICLVLVCLIVLMGATIFAFLNSVPVNLNTFGTNVKMLAPELYNYNMEVLSDKYPIEITPAGWVFSVLWPLIYVWNFLSATYMTASLCFQPQNNPILRSTPLLPRSFLIGWIVTFGGLIGWLFSFDREVFELSCFLLFTSTFASYFCLGISYKAIYDDRRHLRKHSKAMLYCVRILVHNGLAVLTAWITCASLLNLNVVICYYDSPNKSIPTQRGLISPRNAGSVMLALALLAFIVWFMVENFVFEKYCRHTVTLYPTLTFAMSGLVLRNWRVPIETRNSVLGCVALSVCGLALVVRTCLLVYRHKCKGKFRSLARSSQ